MSEKLFSALSSLCGPAAWQPHGGAAIATSRFLTRVILVPAQHGFRKGRSTISAITALLNDVYDNRNNTSPAYLVFLDLTKAFDSVSHELLLSKLNETGISIEFCKWMESYLANRVHRVKLNNSASPYTAIKYGVPQGSVLGPILFSIYINNLGFLLDDIQIYADANICCNI